MFDGYWKRRAEKAETELAALKAATAEIIAGIELMAKDRAVLIGITTKPKERANRFTFIRNDHLYQIDTMGTWNDNVAQWKKDLLEPTP